MGARARLDAFLAGTMPVADYATYCPTLEQIQSSFKQIDWAAYNASAKIFQDYYKQKIGQ